MSQPDNTRLLEKIQALLNKAGCPGVTAEESQSFFAKAQELLVKHGLETSDLDKVRDASTGKPSYDIGKKVSNQDRQKHAADDYIWQILERAFGVKSLYSTNPITGVHSWMFVGEPAQIALSELAAGVLYRVMTSNVRKYIKAHGLRKTEAVKRSYFLGVKNGYIQKLQEAEAAAYADANKDQKDAYGLVLVGRSEAIKTYVDEIIKPTSRKAVKLKLDSDAYKRGHELGRNLDLRSDNKIG